MRRALLVVVAALVLSPAHAAVAEASSGFSVSPRHLDFGQLHATLGFSPDKQLTVTNNTGHYQYLADYEVSDVNHFNPVTAAVNPCYDYESPSAALPPGASCDFALRMVLNDPGGFRDTFQSFWLAAANNAPRTSPKAFLRGTVLP